MTFTQEQRPRRRGTFIAAAVIVVVIVIAGIVAGIVLGVRGHTTTAAPSTAAPSASSTGQAASTTDGACGQVPYETTNALAAAPATKWVAWSATTLATSSTAGPEKNTDGVRTCYSRTPTGALFAAYNAGQYCSDTTVYSAAMEAAVAPGPGLTAAESIAKSAPACQPSGQYVQGFKITSYDGQTATLYLAINAPSGLTAVGFQVEWVDGDWKLLLDANGNPTVASSQITSTAGFTPWGPTNG